MASHDLQIIKVQLRSQTTLANLRIKTSFYLQLMATLCRYPARVVDTFAKAT